MLEALFSFSTEFSSLLVLKEDRQIDSSEDSGMYFVKLLKNKTVENFVVSFLDNAKRIIKTEIMQVGTIDSATVYPREILKRALLLQASSVVLAHNHPGGRLSPSGHDIHMTHCVNESLKTLDIELCDHVIVADDNYYSFAENGIL
jgi:DNA repair protein RadC